MGSGAGENASSALLGRDRTPFLPDRLWVREPEATAYTLRDRSRDAEAWQRAADSDLPLVTQWDNGEHRGDAPGSVSTCSASMPSVVDAMLADLDVRKGMRVLEIGTGTGYTAALLKDRVGPQGSVVSTEIDPGLAALARANLAAVGVEAPVISGDGADGLMGPFDRVHVTCGMRSVPYVWIEQTRPQGVIVMPWGTDFCPHDRLLTLTVTDDGTASGRFGTGLSFMKMRSQEAAWRRATGPEGWTDDAAVSEPDLVSEDIAEALDGYGELVLGFLLPGIVKTIVGGAEEPSRTLYLFGHESCAAIAYGSGQPVSAWQYGPRFLADDFADALTWWHHHGRPDARGFGLRVSPTADGVDQVVWFAHDRPVAPTWRH